MADSQQTPVYVYMYRETQRMSDTCGSSLLWTYGNFIWIMNIWTFISFIAFTCNDIVILYVEYINKNFKYV